MGKQLPSVGYVHVGANVRESSLYPNNRYSGMGMRQALAEFEREGGHALDALERREFFRGWRQNQVVRPANTLIELAQYLNADQLDALGAEAQALADKWEAILRS